MQLPEKPFTSLKPHSGLHVLSSNFPSGSLSSPLHTTSRNNPTTIPWVVNEFLAPDAVSLGRLVRSVESPQQDFYAPHTSLITEGNVAQVRYEGFQETLDRTEGSKLHTFLTNLFSISSSGTKSASSGIQSTACVTYQLKNSGDFFAQLCEDPAAREFLDRAFRFRKEVYLVVGLKTLQDAKVVLQSEQKRDTEISIEVPVEEALLAAGVPIAQGITGGAGVTSSQSSSASTSLQFQVPGEKVIAAQFRKLKFKLFSSREVDNAFLEDGNRWKVYAGGQRGGTEADSDTDDEETDVIDVSLGSAELKLENRMESIDLEGEEIIFASGDKS